MTRHPESPSSWARYRRCPREYAFWREELPVEEEAGIPPEGKIEALFAGAPARFRHEGISDGEIRLPYGSSRPSWRARAAMALAAKARPQLRPVLLGPGGGVVRTPAPDPAAIEAEVARLRGARDADVAFFPRVGPWCERCRWRGRCPAFVRPSSRLATALSRLAEAAGDLPAARIVGAEVVASLGFTWRTEPVGPSGAGILHPVGRAGRWGWIVGTGAEAAEVAPALALSLDRASAGEQAHRDRLTGLFTRGWFEENFPDPPPVGLALVFLDIDRFKRVNDERGHATGDRALAHVAGVLLAFAAARGLPAFRYGGEEMGAFGSLDLASASALAESIRAEVARAPIETPPAPLPLTVSLGVGNARAGEDRAGLFARVDAALYRAKANGRNRVETAG